MGEKQSALALVERDSSQLAPVVAVAMDMLRLSPPETVAAAMDKILAVQERYEAGEARKAYAAAIVAAKRELPAVIGYDATNKFAGYRYSTLAAIVDGVTKVLSRHDLSASWDISSSPPNVTVVCKITHCAGHVEVSPPMTAPVEATTSAAGKEKKTPVQAIMSAATSLRRMTVMSMLGLSSGEEGCEEDGPPPQQQMVNEPVRSVEPASEAIDDMIKRWKAALFTAQTAEDCDRIGREMGKKLQKGMPAYSAALEMYESRKRELSKAAPKSKPPTDELREGEIVSGDREPGSDDA